jgi:hypothetical protein
MKAAAERGRPTRIAADVATPGWGQEHAEDGQEEAKGTLDIVAGFIVVRTSRVRIRLHLAVHWVVGHLQPTHGAPIHAVSAGQFGGVLHFRAAGRALPRHGEAGTLTRKPSRRKGINGGTNYGLVEGIITGFSSRSVVVVGPWERGRWRGGLRR